MPRRLAYDCRRSLASPPVGALAIHRGIEAAVDRVALLTEATFDEGPRSRPSRERTLPALMLSNFPSERGASLTTDPASRVVALERVDGHRSHLPRAGQHWQAMDRVSQSFVRTMARTKPMFLVRLHPV